ncbi:MAG: IPT/TIG domain-containing protein, partial [Deltaproteobacteria bacterium]|nr:IPT/TIG domain-containing protein [Deltaproteobacteria bacterium]
QPGQLAQFTAMFASAEQSWAEAAEYKILLEGKQKGAKNGIKAYTRCGDGAWSPAEVLWELDSWGTTENTAVEAVCEFVPECEEDGDCDPGERCAEGLCEPWCDGDGDCPEGLLCLDHQCGEGCHDDADCGPQSLCSDGACVPKPVSSPEVGSVSPDSGPVEGGTLVTLAGADFQDGAAVTFGGAAATAVDVKGPEQLTCVTPAHAAGKVDVKLVNPDGGTTTFLKGFTYVDEAEAPLLASVEPLDGPVTGGTVVSLHGQNFLTNPAVFFGAKQASAVEFKSSVLVLATTPPGTLGAVDVRLVNSDAQEDTLEDGFTYVPNVPDWTHLLSPLAATALTGGPLPTFYAEVYEAGLTPGAGAAPGMQVELIHGPEGSDPGTWTGVAAIYDSESGNNDVWKVPGLSLSQAGLRGFTFRFSLDGAHWVLADSDGTQNGFSASLTGVLEILEPGDDLLALSVAPAFGTVLGGTTVMVTGANFSEGMTVTLGGTEADFEVLGPGSITVTTPPGAAGLADLVLSHPEDGTAALEDAFEYVLVATPTVDGDLEDWDEAFRIAENSLTSDWGPLLNALHALYVAYDDENLYVAVEGTAEVLNYILGYLDVDFGLGTGASGMTSLSDNGGNGDLDDALSSVFEVSAEGFGAEFGFGAQGGAEALPGALVPAAGWRGLSPPGDFSWLAGPVR